MLQYDVFLEVATFLGTFGVEGLLLASQAYARFVRRFISTRQITNIRTLTMLHVSNMNVLELRFTYFKAPNVAMQEVIHISEANVEEALTILLRNTVLSVLVIRCVAPVGRAIKNAFRKVAKTLAIAERLELELNDRLFEDTDELLTFLEAPHKIKASHLQLLHNESLRSFDHAAVADSCRRRKVRRVDRVFPSAWPMAPITLYDDDSADDGSDAKK